MTESIDTTNVYRDRVRRWRWRRISPNGHKIGSSNQAFKSRRIARASAWRANPGTVIKADPWYPGGPTTIYDPRVHAASKAPSHPSVP